MSTPFLENELNLLNDTAYEVENHRTHQDSRTYEEEIFDSNHNLHGFQEFRKQQHALNYSTD